MLTERAVETTWNRLFAGGESSESLFQRAEALIEELRLESPLRLRLTNELDELRSLHAKSETAAK